MIIHRERVAVNGGIFDGDTSWAAGMTIERIDEAMTRTYGFKRTPLGQPMVVDADWWRRAELTWFNSSVTVTAHLPTEGGVGLWFVNGCVEFKMITGEGLCTWARELT